MHVTHPLSYDSLLNNSTTRVATPEGAPYRWYQLVVSIATDSTPRNSKAYTEHLNNLGVDTDLLWKQIKDCIIKSIFSVHPHIIAAMQELNLHRY